MIRPRVRSGFTLIELLATIYHSVGIEPATIQYNHLNQPRELVQGDTVTGILA